MDHSPVPHPSALPRRGRHPGPWRSCGREPCTGSTSPGTCGRWAAPRPAAPRAALGAPSRAASRPEARAPSSFCRRRPAAPRVSPRPRRGGSRALSGSPPARTGPHCPGRPAGKRCPGGGGWQGRSRSVRRAPPARSAAPSGRSRGGGSRTGCAASGRGCAEVAPGTARRAPGAGTAAGTGAAAPPRAADSGRRRHARTACTGAPPAPGRTICTGNLGPPIRRSAPGQSPWWGWGRRGHECGVHLLRAPCLPRATTGKVLLAVMVRRKGEERVRGSDLRVCLAWSFLAPTRSPDSAVLTRIDATTRGSPSPQFPQLLLLFPLPAPPIYIAVRCSAVYITSNVVRGELRSDYSYPLESCGPLCPNSELQQSLDRAGTAQCRRWERSQLHQNGKSLRRSRTVVGFSAVFIARHSSRSSINVFEVDELLFFQIHNKIIR